jgi:hypothetical protein
MPISITIDTDNAAFDDGYSEVVRLLRDLAKRIERDGRVEDRKLYDINGNHVLRLRARVEIGA